MKITGKSLYQNKEDLIHKVISIVVFAKVTMKERKIASGMELTQLELHNTKHRPLFKEG